ncbi:MAG: hypothetical protein E7115_02345 [Bacteroidales bacterium]|nr:hypothetical protein [Bacteroidales bacterium]
MKRMIFLISLAAFSTAMISCNGGPYKQEKKDTDCCARQEKGMVTDAIREGSNDFEQVEIVGNSVVYTHIFDGIIDVKTYTYDGDVCVEAERVYVFPDQMSALRHYRRAIEKAELYDDIRLMKNEVRYDLKEAQHKLETAGLTKEQLKAKFDKQLSEAKKAL